MSDDTFRDENSEQDLEELAKMYADDFEMDGSLVSDSRKEEVSLEELGQAFARVIGTTKSPPGSGVAETQSTTIARPDSRTIVPFPSSGTEGPVSSGSVEQPSPEQSNDDDQFPVTPLSIVEAVLLIGRPDSGSISATEIAGLMRGVTESEVDLLVEELNADYSANHRALRIANVDGGYRMQLAEDLQSIRQSFLGPSRPIKLSQPAIDCISLVSYQPGITRERLEEQLGKSSGAILNQLVRRQLLEIRREKVHLEKKLVPRYYPTQRLLDLVGLESLDDLPTAEEWLDRV